MCFGGVLSYFSGKRQKKPTTPCDSSLSPTVDWWWYKDAILSIKQGPIRLDWSYWCLYTSKNQTNKHDALRTSIRRFSKSIHFEGFLSLFCSFFLLLCFCCFVVFVVVCFFLFLRKLRKKPIPIVPICFCFIYTFSLTSFVMGVIQQLERFAYLLKL